MADTITDGYIDKASADYLVRISEPYLPYPTIKKEDISAYSTTISNGFHKQDYPYFYFTSTYKDRVLYTNAGNIIPQNLVCFTEYLSDYVDELEIGEVITIHYGA